ncbi:hypothetical protein E4U38_006781 [Claviceps purpurea]|nr:hypothetical protein E4U38_006781 [Claviceps purpurea]KAG6212348.1 hypothetical protein E4U50_001941 [Claviceps purpurea]KAG6306472.1 hypothetical protein E4U45_007043 [Claviceps purpurea]KAG6310494.1 hypothetical protein E4U44_005458 [Claviceps purpurea]
MPLFHRRRPKSPCHTYITASTCPTRLQHHYSQCLEDVCVTPRPWSIAPPQQSPEEIRAMEAEAVFTVQQVVAAAFMLYLSPFAIDMASRVF